jgi:hypothetical protein
MATPDRLPTAKLPGDPEMVRLLEEMLELDEDITARAVARKHPHIAHASSITRHSVRSDLLAKYQARQTERRAWRARLRKRSQSKTAAEMTKKDERIAELTRQVEILKASHLAMIRAVGELGGMNKWLKFYESFREVREELKGMGAMPHAEIREIGSSGKR